MKTYLESSIYFTEKDIYDALMSSKRTMTIPLIIELARDKGIILSPEEPRDELVKYLSSLLYDYYDLNVLIDHITPSYKKEKSKVTTIDTKIDAIQLKSIVKEFTDKDLVINVNTDLHVTNKTILKIGYDEVDFSKTRLRQKIRKESTIEITEKDGKSTISKPSNDKVDEIMQKILEKVENKNNIKIAERKINLGAFEHKKKIQYFTSLINSIDGCKLHDVVKVSVNYNDDDDNDDDDDNSDIKENVITMITMITNASFRGKNLLSTSEYQDLKNKGFYITSIIWNAIENKTNGDKLEFEASLTPSSNNIEEVSFTVKGIYRFKEKGQYTSTKRALNSDEIIKYTNILEKAAFKVYDDIENSKE